MSNYLAIATVTTVFKRMIEAAIQFDVPGATVTTVRPDAAMGRIPQVGVNIYLYQASPNPAWRNADLRTRRPKGDLTKQAQAGLDLHYILTFYGDEGELEPQRLLGSTVRTLADQPIVTIEQIRAAIEETPVLHNSSLDEQFEQVTILPTMLSTDELSKVWSVFFQAPYVLSFACQAGVVLIEGEKPGLRSLPVRDRIFYTAPNMPVIDRVIMIDRQGNEKSANQFALAHQTLAIRGQRLDAEVTNDELDTEEQRSVPRGYPARRGEPCLQIGEVRITPQSIQANELRLEVAQLPELERESIRAGVQTLQVVYPIVRRPSNEVEFVDPMQWVGSNVFPFTIAPTITNEPSVSQVERDSTQIVRAIVMLEMDLVVGQKQRVFLILNSISQPSVGYVFPAERRRTETRTIHFIIQNVVIGTYLVRVEIDGAESVLEFDGRQFLSPRIVL